MPSSSKPSILQFFAHTPTLAEVVGGTVLGIVLTYFGYYAADILSGTHLPDFEFFANLLLLGIPVLMLGWYQQHSAK